MSEKLIPDIERDDVINNQAMIAKEYSITIDQVTGKIYFAGELENSQVIIQGIVPQFHKNHKQLPAMSFDYTKKINGRNATFSGFIYFEDLPVDALVNGNLVGSNGLPVPVKKDEKDDKIEDAIVIEEEIEEKTETKSTEELEHMIPNLAEIRPKTLKPPAGLSRTKRKKWWDAVREKYPDAFDARLNYIGFPDKQKEPDKVVSEEKKEDAKPVVSNEPRPPKIKPSAVTGIGNEFTNMADPKVRSGYFMGKFFPAKDAYSVISTPAETFENSRLIFCNKARTAEMLLQALNSSPSFGEALNGEEKVYPATNLRQGVFTSDRLVYYVTNAVTAAQALGSTIPEAKES